MKIYHINNYPTLTKCEEKVTLSVSDCKNNVQWKTQKQECQNPLNLTMLFNSRRHPPYNTEDHY